MILEQLITNAIKQENPSLEERKRELLREHEEYREKLDDFQNKLLEDLANSAGDILENEVDSVNYQSCLEFLFVLEFIGFFG